MIRVQTALRAVEAQLASVLLVSFSVYAMATGADLAAVLAVGLALIARAYELWLDHDARTLQAEAEQKLTKLLEGIDSRFQKVEGELTKVAIDRVAGFRNRS